MKLAHQVQLIKRDAARLGADLAALAQLRASRDREAAERSQELSPDIPAGTSLVLDAQSPYHDLLRPARYKVYYGGRGAAKTWAFGEALIRRAVAEPVRVLCTREFQSSIKDSVHRVLADTISRLGVARLFDVTQNAIRGNTGAEFIFKGLHHNAEEIKSTEGIDVCWCAEAQNTSDDSLRYLIPTIRKEGSEIWLEFNVGSKDDPVFKRFVTNTPPDSVVHKVNFDVNPFFPEVLRREMEYDKAADYNAYLHVWEGEARKIDDAVIFGGRFRVATFPDDLWTKAERLHFGADFGFARDPSTLIRCFILENVLYIEHEAYGVGVELEDMATFYDAVPECRNWPIKGDNSRPETISFLRGKDFNITAADKWPGCIEDRIAHIRGFKEIVIHERCKHTAQEARLYSYKKDRITGEVLPTVIDKHNHCWDAIGYALDGHIQRRGLLGVWARLAG